MKILPVSLIREADAYTIENEPIADVELMERAATLCFQWLEKTISRDRKIKVFCGSGNNGGDGLAIARMMHKSGFHVEVLMLSTPRKMSPECKVNLLRMQECGAPVKVMHDAGYGMRDTGFGMRDTGSASPVDDHQLPVISRSDIVIDALFGSGLTRSVEGFMAVVIKHINDSGAFVVAIDVPSGLYCDATTPADGKHAVILADHTLTFSPPKMAFFFPENDVFVGEWTLLDIGILQKFIDSVAVRNFMLEKDDVSQMLKKRNKFEHKGNFGHALLICGSTGKMGAAILAAKACLRSGPGLVTIRVPESGITILQIAVPEAMVSIDEDEDCFTTAPGLNAYSAIAIGPGIGTSLKTASALKILIQETKIPVIFDADAINLLSENKTWLGFLPENSIFTPHPKEFERLVGTSSNDFERNQMQREFSHKYQCYVVLKGAHSAITTPDGRCFFNTTGNPGMATGGSGDVLTGIIAGLRAQGYSPLECCLLGVFVHGLAGDLAASSQGFEALIANDIIKNLGKSFQLLYGKF